MKTLITSFGGLALFMIIAAGYIMLTEPEKGREFFKNVGLVFLGLAIVCILLYVLRSIGC
jgi:hypothetical protein